MTDFVYGTQYYRAPTPLPEEWENDFKNFSRHGLNTIQLRLQWRQHEKRRGEYDFSDSDRLFELAEKYQIKVIVKLMLENAPDYVFHELNGRRIGLNGIPLTEGAHGAFYIGGWRPCFDNPNVMQSALQFVEKTVTRYRNKQVLLYWNIWNEPRSKPIGDCCCEHSTELYRRYVAEKFGTVEQLNKFYGKGWEDFKTILPPGSAQDYAELELWRQFALVKITRHLRQVRDVVLSLDDRHDVYCHAGCCLAVQDIADDSSDDIANAGLFTFYGSSFPVYDTFNSVREDSEPFLIGDWMHHVCPEFFLNEIYPEWGNWMPGISEKNFLYKMFSALACGVKGIMFWQYRAERLGCENNLSGLVNIDGTPKMVTALTADIGDLIKKHKTFFASAEPVYDRIGILYDLRSDMISRIESVGPGQWDFDTEDGTPGVYKHNFQGCYALLRDMHLIPQLIDSRNLAENIDKVDILFVPELFMPSHELLDILEQFISEGGKVVADSGFALRMGNTWLNYPWPGGNGQRLFGCKVNNRTSCRYQLRKGKNIDLIASGFSSELEPLSPGTFPLASWNDGGYAAVGNEKSLLIGTAFGSAFLNGNSPGIAELLRKKLGNFLPKRDLPEKLYIRQLRSGEKYSTFIFNRSIKDHVVHIENKEIKISAGETIFLPPSQQIE